MAAIVLSTLGYIGTWARERKNYIVYILVCSYFYLAALTFVRTLDILLPIYFIVLLFPMAFSARKISTTTFLLSLYYAVYLLYGMVFQNTIASIVAFVSRNWQFIAFFLIYDILKNKNQAYLDSWSISKRNFRFAIVVESVLGVYLAVYNLSRGRVLRLVADAQPVTGNIAIIVLPILAYLFFFKEEDGHEDGYRSNHIQYLRYALILFAWTILSGTRGYALVYAATLVPMFYSFFFRQEENRRSRNRVFLFLIVVAILTGIVIFVPTIIERVMSILRIGAGASTGIRRYENAAVVGFWKDASLRVKLFGIGLGGTPGNYSEFLVHLQSQFALGMWDRAHYLNDSGAIFHNLYACILCSQGAVGIGVVFIAFLGIWKRISLEVRLSKGLRATLHMFLIGFAIMNYYRWSATCGICELIVLACVLTLCRKRAE